MCIGVGKKWAYHNGLQSMTALSTLDEHNTPQSSLSRVKRELRVADEAADSSSMDFKADPVGIGC